MFDDITELLKKYYPGGTYGLNESTNTTDTSVITPKDTKLNDTMNLMGLLGSPEVLTGLGLISRGSQGERIGTAALPSFIDALSGVKAVRSLTASQQKEESIKKFADKVPPEYQDLFKAFPEETIKLLFAPKNPTLSGEALKVADKLKGALTKTEFDAAFSKLSQVERDLYNKEILTPNLFETLIGLGGMSGAKDFAAAGSATKTTQTPDVQKTKTITTTTAPSLNDFVTQAKQLNPTYTDAQLTDIYKKKYGGK